MGRNCNNFFSLPKCKTFGTEGAGLNSIIKWCCSWWLSPLKKRVIEHNLQQILCKSFILNNQETTSLSPEPEKKVTWISLNSEPFFSNVVVHSNRFPEGKRGIQNLTSHNETSTEIHTVLQDANPTKHSPFSMATYEVYLNLNPLFAGVSPCPAEPSPSNFRMVSIPSWGEKNDDCTATVQPFWPTCHVWTKSSAKIREPDLRGHLTQCFLGHGEYHQLTPL